MSNGNTTAHGLSPRAEKTIQRLSTITVLILAVSAAILSFSGLRTLGITAGFDENFAWLLPVIVDGMVLTGSLGVVSANLVGISTWYPWLLTYLGVIISVWGNVASAPDDLVAKIVHAIAPITFALSVEGMLRIYRASAHATALREQKAYEQEEKRIEREEKRLEREAKARLTRFTAPPLPPATPATPIQAPVQAPTAPVSPSRPVDAPTFPSTVSPLTTPNNNNGNGVTARSRITEYIQTNPEATGGQVARALDLDASYTRKILRDIRDAAAKAAQINSATPTVTPSTNELT